MPQGATFSITPIFKFKFRDVSSISSMLNSEER